MPFEPINMPILLVLATPTKMTPDSLSTQLTAVGLTCSDANEALLPSYIEQTRRDMAQGGKVQSFKIMKVKAENETSAIAAADYEQSATGNWTIRYDFEYQTEFLYINYEEHFNWLLQNQPSFVGIRSDPPKYQGTESTVSAVQKQFVDCSYTASAVVVEGLDEDSIEAAMWNAIAPLTNENAKDYDNRGSRSLFLVDNYDPVKERASGLGILTVKWHLKVWDFRKKIKNELEHKWELTINAWSALYNKADDIEADYAFAKAHFG